MAKKEKVYGTHLKVSAKRAGHKIGGTVGIFVFLLVLALFMALPIYLAVVMSLKPVQELFVFPPKLYVIDPTLSNYSAMFRLCSDLWVPFSRYVFNSVFVTVSVTVCQVVFSAMAAFCLAKVRFPGAKAINAIIVVALLYQSNVIYIMQYMVMAKMGMIDTYWALILPSVAAPMNLFLMRQSMTQVPDAMIEAAKVDGADMFRICWQVVMPNQKPALMTVIIFSFQAAWNIQGGTLVFSESLKTLPTVVQQAASAGLARAGVAMAAAVFMLVPPIVIFMLAQRAVSGLDLGCGAFNTPSDLFRDWEDRFYIADSGNNRIVVTDSGFSKATRIYDKLKTADGETTLKDPEGIYVSRETQCMYIADTGNSRLLVCDLDGNVQLELTRPDSTLYENETFKPQKVVVDKAGNIYMVLNNITNGSAMFNSDGEFQGYFGANSVDATAEVVANYFWNMIATDEMRANSSRNVAAGITSFDIDDEGFIYTVTQSSSSEADRVKKVNPAGYNLFSVLEATFGDLNSVYDSTANENYTTQMVDIDIDDMGRINCLDLETGRVFQYDEDGSLLFILGTTADQLGGFSMKVSAVETMGKNIYVSDAMKNTVTIFTETEFGGIVHNAVALYNAGYYAEALEPWREVLKRDGNYQMAYIGISSALYNEGNYKEAMKYAKLAQSRNLYDKAFEGYRSEWLNQNFTWIILVVVVLIAAAVFFHFRNKKKKKNQPKNLIEMLHEGEEE